MLRTWLRLGRRRGRELGRRQRGYGHWHGHGRRNTRWRRFRQGRWRRRRRTRRRVCASRSGGRRMLFCRRLHRRRLQLRVQPQWKARRGGLLGHRSQQQPRDQAGGQNRQCQADPPCRVYAAARRHRADLLAVGVVSADFRPSRVQVLEHLIDQAHLSKTHPIPVAASNAGSPAQAHARYRDGWRAAPVSRAAARTWRATTCCLPSP